MQKLRIISILANGIRFRAATANCAEKQLQYFAQLTKGKKATETKAVMAQLQEGKTPWWIENVPQCGAFFKQEVKDE